LILPTVTKHTLIDLQYNPSSKVPAGGWDAKAPSQAL